MYVLRLIVGLLSVVSILSVPISPRDLHPDAGLKIDEFLEKYGYPMESHEVQTEDGYLLTMHRIPHGRNNGDTNEIKPVVLLMHGLWSSSIDFVNMGPEKGIGLLLADAGFDVWLGNQRGNTWSRKHITLDPDENAAEFFDFSFHEIGVYDLPAKIDHILNVTGQKSLRYIGHSQGTTAFFAMSAERPEYNEKILLMEALAPVAFMSNLTSPLVRFLAENLGALNLIIDILNIHEFLPHFEVITELGDDLCSDQSEYQDFCPLILYILGGFDEAEIDEDFFPVITSNAPAGASIKQIIHYLQEVNSGNFAQFDYGALGNFGKYGDMAPPNYDISKTTAPIILHYAENDWMASVNDVEKYSELLPNLVAKKLVPFPQFNHLDFLWAVDVVELLNNDLVAEFKETL